MDWPIKRVPGGVTFVVRVTPRSRKNEILGTEGESLRVKLNAPPVEGAANAALRDFLASRLGIRKSAVIIVAGHTSRNKIVRVEGVTPDRARALLSSFQEAGDA